MSTTEIQIVSPRADNTYSGKTVAVDTRASTLTMWRRTPLSHYDPRMRSVVANAVEDTFTQRRFDVDYDYTLEVLCDADANCRDVIEHLLARDREFHRLEDELGYEIAYWRSRKRDKAERELQATVEKDPVT